MYLETRNGGSPVHNSQLNTFENVDYYRQHKEPSTCQTVDVQISLKSNVHSKKDKLNGHHEAHETIFTKHAYW
jgi:hypothetical protein